MSSKSPNFMEKVLDYGETSAGGTSEDCPDPKGHVRVIVEYKDHPRPLALNKASVELSGPGGSDTKPTKSKGVAEFRDLDPDDYRVRATYDDMKEGAKDTVVYRNRTSRVKLLLIPLGTLKVQVKDADGNNLSGATVTVSNVPDGNTNNAGLCSFTEVEAGSYRIQVRKKGYTSETISRRLDFRPNNNEITVDVQIQKVTVSIRASDGRSEPFTIMSVNKRDQLRAVLTPNVRGTYRWEIKNGAGKIELQNESTRTVTVRAGAKGSIAENAEVVEVYFTPDGSEVMDPVSVVLTVIEPPTITIDDPKIVLVKKGYQGKSQPDVKPHRIKVLLSTTTPRYNATGTLRCNQAGLVKLYNAEEGGNELYNGGLSGRQIVLNDIDLSNEYTLYVEGVEPSSSVNDIEFTLTLQEGGAPVLLDPVTSSLTCVDLSLDIYRSRPGVGGEPDKLTDTEKIDPGRPVIVQGQKGDRLFAERAMLVIGKAKPNDLSGNLVLKRISDRVDVFAENQEIPASGHVPLVQCVFANNTINQNSGKKLWVQGAAKSAAMGDTGLKIELENLPDKEGDRVTMTVLKTELRICKSRTDVPSAGDPDFMSDADKIDVGQYLHVQSENHHGRAMLVVRKIEPDGFTGALVLTAWNIDHSNTETKASANHRVKLFNDEVPADNQAIQSFDLEIDYDDTFPNDGKKYWAEGASVSDQLCDTQIRLGIREYDKGCDRVSLTVVQFSDLEAEIPAPGNPDAPYRIDFAKDEPEPDNFSPDFDDNEPIVLMENSIPDDDQIGLSVQIEPAAAAPYVVWDVVRDRRPAPDGDHADIIKLSPNAVPTIKPDKGDTLKATLKADAVGSFHVCPYIDCNASGSLSYNNDAGARIDREPFLIMNLVLVRATVDEDNSAAHDTIKAVFEEGENSEWLQVSSGEFGINDPGNEAIHMNVVADVISGGGDGRRCLDRVYAGWVNNEIADDIVATYGPLYGSSTYYEHKVPNVFASNRDEASAKDNSKIPIFLPKDPEPVPVDTPLLDASRDKAGTGGVTACLQKHRVEKQDNEEVGQRFRVEAVDSPAWGAALKHPGGFDAFLRNFRFSLKFTAYLCFWAETDDKDAIPDRLYAVLSHLDWSMEGEWKIETCSIDDATWKVNDKVHFVGKDDVVYYIEDVVKKPVVKINKKVTYDPLVAAENNPVKVRPPTGLSLVAKDARNGSD
ncbi:carboxypeptidase regulatory-like domain-containing protein [Candidatus Poribacteria bacterium]